MTEAESAAKRRYEAYVADLILDPPPELVDQAYAFEPWEDLTEGERARFYRAEVVDG